MMWFCEAFIKVCFL